jgi:hypothetical protein
MDDQNTLGANDFWLLIFIAAAIIFLFSVTK